MEGDDEKDIDWRRNAIADLHRGAGLARRLAAATTEWACQLDAACLSNDPVPGPALMGAVTTLVQLHTALALAALNAYRDGKDPYETVKASIRNFVERSELEDTVVGELIDHITEGARDARLEDGLVRAEIDWMMGLGRTKAARDAATGGS